MSQATIGKPKNYKTGGSLPGVAEKIRKSWTLEKRQAAHERGIRFSQNRQWRQKCGSSGDKNPMWEGGRSQLPYAPGWTRWVKNEARRRAGNRCEDCKIGGLLHVHHKDGQKDNHDLSNLRVLCPKHHKAAHIAILKFRKEKSSK